MHYFDEYERDDEPKVVNTDGDTEYVQRYKNEHQNEYTIISEQEIRHYKSGLLERVWKLRNGTIDGDFTDYKDGYVTYSQSLKSIGDGYAIRIKNTEHGVMKELVDLRSPRAIYRGDFDDTGKKKGRCFKIDADTNDLILEGIWKDDKLESIIRIFEGKKMIEFRSTVNNLKLSERIPIYVGEYQYNEFYNTCFRSGYGFIVNEDGVAISAGKWENGVETEVTTMKNGWYNVEENSQIFSSESEKIEAPAYKFKFASFLDLNLCKQMKSLKIGDFNFCNTTKFEISGNSNLETVSIGQNSFYSKDKKDQMTHTFSIFNCANLKSIHIGANSFLSFSEGFELRELPNLEVLEIGEVDVETNCFSCCNFVLQGECFSKTET